MTIEIELENIRRALGDHVPLRTPFPGENDRASVALILAGEATGLDMALIRRAERPGDPWSGQMALPGGRADPGETGPEAVAERETMEEVGIALQPRQRVGTMDEIPVKLGRIDTGIVLTPVVYHLGPDRQPFHINGEVAQAYWVPLSHLLDPARITRKTVTRDGMPMHFPAVAYQGEIIWGLTYRVLTAFSRLIGCPLPDVPPPLTVPPRP